MAKENAKTAALRSRMARKTARKYSQKVVGSSFQNRVREHMVVVMFLFEGLRLSVFEVF